MIWNVGLPMSAWLGLENKGRLAISCPVVPVKSSFGPSRPSLWNGKTSGPVLWGGSPRRKGIG